jgi:hypothetical protein
MIDEMKRNSMNDREFVQKELQRKIDELEREIRDLKSQFEDEKYILNEAKDQMKSNYERQLID